MRKQIITLFSILGYCFGASLEQCPEGSSCHSSIERIETSFEFLNKYNPKDYRSISSLIITNASINKVDPKLKYLKNLVSLDLSYNSVQISSIPALNSLRTLILKGNNLKSINISLLPQYVEHLDLSENLLSQIPRDWRLLKNLKIMDLHKNPIDCDCNNVLNYDRLIKSGVTIPKPLTCHSPLKFIGKDIAAVNCSYDDIMVYDEPEEGSGDLDIFEEKSNEKNLALINDDNDVYERNTLIDETIDFPDHKTAFDENEGSGEDGSGFGVILPESGVLGCLENCSTPVPLVTDATSSPLPSLVDQARMLIDDLNIFEDKETPVSTSTTTKAPTTENTIVYHPAPVEESTILRKNHKPVESSKSDAELFSNETRTGELERATAAPKNSTAVYAVIGVGLFIAILFIVVIVKRRKSKKSKVKNRREIPGAIGEEMKPLSKLPIHAVNDSPLKDSSNHIEQIPLINGGQNGKTIDDSPRLNSFTPMPHPELPNKDEDGAVPLYNGSTLSKDTDPVEIRPKTQPELLTPQRERVTIRESEIPDSIPRTPLFVHRQKNSDGEIVTTFVP